MSSPRGPRIGIVTGSGPEAGIDLWQKILDENRLDVGPAFRGDIDAPNVTILSIPELGHSMDLPDTKDEVWASLSVACEQIAQRVDVFAIACNTLYAFEEAIGELELSATLLSPVDSVAAEAKRRGLETIGLLAAGPVMDLEHGSSPYGRLADTLSIELPKDRAGLHEVIKEVKVHGGSTPSIAREFASIVSELSADTAALACTELPLIDATGIDVSFIDPTQLLARDLVAFRDHL